MKQAPTGLNTLIASGDVYIRSEKPLQDIPNVDVVLRSLGEPIPGNAPRCVCIRPEAPGSS